MLRYRFDTEGMMTPIGNISQHPMNDNNGDVDEIVTSIRVTGVYRPLYVSRETGFIVAGNHTYLAMLELGAQFVPVAWLAGLSEVDELRILAADNKIARNARPDRALTGNLLQRIVELSDLGTDKAAALIGTGHSETEYLRLIKDPTPLNLSGVGRETLEHWIQCPECFHKWKRSGPKAEEDD